MDGRAEIREFLATRRAKNTPEQAGLPPGSGRRRVPGLRRTQPEASASPSSEPARTDQGAWPRPPNHLGGVAARLVAARASGASAA